MLLPFSQRAKSWEPKAIELRSLAGIRPNELLDPWGLAPKVGLLIIEASHALLGSLPDEHRLQLLGAGGRKWSGGVLPIPLPDDNRICILNPTHTRGRQKSTLMEEVAHAHLRHQPTKLVFNGDSMRARDFNGEQEAEAYGIGAAALLPWHSLFRRINEGKTRADIAAEFDVTEELVRYRVQISGAHRLYQARQRAASMV